jgi:hypothetical protein
MLISPSMQEVPVVVRMERFPESMKPGMDATAERWMRVRRAMCKEDQIYVERLAGMIRSHNREGIHAFDDPLEAAVFSVLIELLKELERKRDKGQQLMLGI